MLGSTARFVLAAFLLSPLVCWAEGKDEEELPVGTTAKKLKIQYQSARKAATRIYRVRNTPKGLLTPVEWKAGDETFLDVTLVKCPEKAESCPWATVTIPTVDAVAKGRTILGYGTNKDEFKDTPDAFVRGEPKKGAAIKSPLRTRLTGVIANADGEAIVVDVSVTSAVLRRKEGGFELVYSVSFGEKSHKISLPSHRKDFTPKELRLVWESPEGPKYNDRLKKAGWKAEKGNTLRIIASGTRLVSRKMLLLQGGKKIASVSAPAYAPAEEGSEREK